MLRKKESSPMGWVRFSIRAGAWAVGVSASQTHGQTLPAAPAGAHVTSEYGQEFVDILPGSQAAAPQLSDPSYTTFYSREQGFGAVSTPFRMARTEVTTSSWLAFVNTFADRQAPAWFGDYGFSLTVAGPTTWGARPATLSDGRHGWAAAPGLGETPVGGIPLVEAALYCNWLHNGQSSDFASLTGGAYQLAQFHPPAALFTNPIQREVGASFWIPSIDEWTRAVHFDPASQAMTRWATGDSVPLYGPPEAGEANAGFAEAQLPDGTWVPAQYLPVASYPNVQTPSGLFDGAGGVREWTDTVILNDAVSLAQRGTVAVEGSYAGGQLGWGYDPADLAAYSWWTLGDDRGAGLRIAAAIPSPSSALSLCFLCVLSTLRGKR